MTFLYLALSFIVFLAFVVISIYNSLVKKNKFVDEAWSGIDVQLKRRYDLIPSLVEVVKGYAKHEKVTLEDVVKLRNEFQSAGSINEKIDVDNQMTRALKSIFALSEAYPDLKANQNFIDLQQNISEIENQIQLAKRYYNANVRDYNIIVSTFPSNLVAKKFGFEEKMFYELSNASERENVKISF